MRQAVRDLSMSEIEDNNKKLPQKFSDDFWEILCRYQSLLMEEVEFKKEPSPLLFAPLKKNDNSSFPSTSTQSIADIEKNVSNCNRCGLHATRSIILFTQGDFSSSILIVAPSPSSEDDEGEEFLSGKEGAYLEKWFTSINLDLEKNSYRTSLEKCMTAGGNIALPDEIFAGMPHLQERPQMIQPKVIVALGPFVFSCLTGRSESQFDSDVKNFSHGYRYQGIEVIPLYHPATVLKNSDLRRTVWNVLNYLKEKINGKN